VSRLDNVSVVTKANVYFEGKCISHTVVAADGSRKSVGVILPSALTFKTGAPETMELVEGRCRVTRAGESKPTEYGAGQSFDVPGNSEFAIETLEALHYICHFR
jgi:purine/pyrimidine-nucleoside phosphorylase